MQVFWVGPMLGGIIGGFTYEYTHDSSNQIQHFRRSFRRKQSNLRRSRSLSSNNSMSTELTFSPTAEQPRIWLEQRTSPRNDSPDADDNHHEMERFWWSPFWSSVYRSF